MELANRYFLTWSETAQELGFDDEGLRQAMELRLQRRGADIWLPVGIDSKGGDYLARLCDQPENPIVTHAKNFDEHGRDEDAIFQDGTKFSNNGSTTEASWSATHDHRSGWSNCYLLGGRLILYPETVIYACESCGDLRPHVIGVAPREWCENGFPYDGLAFALIGTDHGFRTRPASLYADTFFYAKDVSRVKKQLAGDQTKTKGNKPMDARERATLLNIIGALADAQGIDLAKHYKAGQAIAAMLEAKGVRLSARTIGEHLKAVREAMDSRKS